MLGNFSFGDYFKKEAIHWAWEFLTDKKWLGLDGERLSVSVYKGKWGFDQEAFDIWNKELGLPADRIACLEEDENYWPASAPSDGPDGVCGPCSEIFYHPPGVDGDVEIWNLVFTQFNRVGNPPDNLKPLPANNIDTGMGLERTAAVLQGVSGISNFENDLLKPLCLAAAEVVGCKYEFDSPQGRPIRRIADHVRAVTFSLHEGVMPDRNNENYVVRQLLRRALLEGYLLGKRDPFLYEIVPAVVTAMKDAYPDIVETADSVQNSMKEEEGQFLETIERGLSRFDKCAAAAKSSDGTISGDDAFSLHTEDGFLIELTEAIAEDRGLKIDMAGYKSRMDEHEEISKGGKTVSVMAAGPLDLIRKEHGETEFVGYESAIDTCKVVALIVDSQSVDSVAAGHKSEVGIILDKTPFYGESGGQVGDTGSLTADGVELKVTDCQKYQQTLFVHAAQLVTGSVKVGDVLTAQVDDTRRSAIRRAHSATHILHHALHETIGDKATQRGSKVEADALRFDFAHKQALTDDEIRQVEEIINAQVASGSEVKTELLPIEEARGRGAMALFGEKYPDNVRVVTMGDFSVELCGGIHLTNTGQVGLCKVTSEEPVAKGVRRITALTGIRALQHVRDMEDVLQKLTDSLQAELKDARKELSKANTQSVAGAIDDLVASATVVGDVRVVAKNLKDVPRESLRGFVDQLRTKYAPICVILGTVVDGKVSLIAAANKELTKTVNASDCVKAAAKIAGGGGGGRPDMAEAGAKIPEKLDEAIAAGLDYFTQKLS
ncbi:UNVERIFIED_CONTAM: hypothetical protein GTU68_034523 [Idotea baltica]|nr:hypothetical protein [Idotea baltica]